MLYPIGLIASIFLLLFNINYGFTQIGVHSKNYYKMSVVLDTLEHALVVDTFQVTFINPSPFPIKEAYFHLYPNAFLPGSPYDHLQRSNGLNPTFGPKALAGKGLEIKEITYDKNKLKYSIDYSLLYVQLPSDLKSGDSITLSMKFTTYLEASGSMRRRMARYLVDNEWIYNAVHWYPVVVKWDTQRGWNKDIHLDKEFYADFSVFDVSLSVPSGFIAEGTGILLNEKEIYNQSSNSLSTPLRDKESKIYYQFQATNFHNFSFTTSRNYERWKQETNEGDLIFLVQRKHIENWKPLPSIINYLKRGYENTFGSYSYKRYILADANEGFECGGMALVGGMYPYNIQLITHEMAHQWYHGMVASNERDAAFLDEGFAQYMTIWGLEYLYNSKSIERSNKKSFWDKNLNSYSLRHALSYLPYVSSFWEGKDMPISTYASDFNGKIRQDGGYSLVYSKGAQLLSTLESIYGTAAFLQYMKEYTEYFRFKHPYPDDFQGFMSGVSNQNQKILFEHFLHSKKFIDYGIKGIKKTKEGNQYLEIIRKGETSIPITIDVFTKDHKTTTFYIPNQSGITLSDNTKAIAKPWVGWGKRFNRKYLLELPREIKVEKAVIDKDFLNGDIDYRNNSWGKVNQKRTLERFEQLIPEYRETVKKIAPYIFGNPVNGLQLGVYLRSFYGGTSVKHQKTIFGIQTGSALDSLPKIGDALFLDAEGKCKISPYHPKWSMKYSAFHRYGYTMTKVGVLKETDIQWNSQKQISYHYYIQALYNTTSNVAPLFLEWNQKADRFSTFLRFDVSYTQSRTKSIFKTYFGVLSSFFETSKNFQRFQSIGSYSTRLSKWNTALNWYMIAGTKNCSSLVGYQPTGLSIEESIPYAVSGWDTRNNTLRSKIKGGGSLSLMKSDSSRMFTSGLSMQWEVNRKLLKINKNKRIENEIHWVTLIGTSIATSTYKEYFGGIQLSTGFSLTATFNKNDIPPIKFYFQRGFIGRDVKNASFIGNSPYLLEIEFEI